MVVMNFQGFLEIVNSLSNKIDLVREIYSAWSTGQPFLLPQDRMKEFMIWFDDLENSVKKFLKQLRKGKTERFYFILGEFGAGKTQLLNYLMGEIKRIYNYEPIYVSMEDFANSSEKDVLLSIRDAISKAKTPVVVMLDDLDFFFSRYDTYAGREVYNFLDMLYRSFIDKFGGKLKAILISISNGLFKMMSRARPMNSKHADRWKVLIDLDLDLDWFLDLSLDIGFKLLAIHYLLEYYSNLRKKIEKNFHIIVEYLYNLTMRISRFGIRTIGLYLKMVNDRLIDFIRYIKEEREGGVNKDNLENYKKVIDRYLQDNMNGIILSFDRAGGFSRYQIRYERINYEHVIGRLEIIGLDEEINGEFVRGSMGVFFSKNEGIEHALNLLKDFEDSGLDYYLIFVPIRKKRKIREEIEKVYLKLGDDMIRFSLVPLDVNMLKYALYLVEDGYSVFVEKNTTAKKDLEEAINILANNKLLEIIRDLPDEQQNCANLVNAIFLWTQSWVLKSGVCRVKKRDLSVIKNFFDSLFPMRYYGLPRDKIFEKMIETLVKNENIRIKRGRLMFNSGMDEDRVIEIIKRIAEEQFCP